MSQTAQPEASAQKGVAESPDAMHLLALSRDELTLAVAERMRQNPLLDYEEEWEEETGFDELLFEASEAETEEAEDDVDTPLEMDMVFDTLDFRLMASLDRELKELFSLSEEVRPERSEEILSEELYREGRIGPRASLHDHLMDQARSSFDTSEELQIAAYIIGNLDVRGFLTGHLLEIAVAHHVDAFKLRKVQLEIQSFDPPGIAASDLQESLLIQLTRRGKHGSCAWAIIADYFDDFLLNNWSLLQEELGLSREQLLATIEQELIPLDLHPGLSHEREFDALITPDIIISEVDDHLEAFVNPPLRTALRMNRRYMRLMKEKGLPSDAQEYLQEKFQEGKQLINTLRLRDQQIARVATCLLEKQSAFFSAQRASLQPMTMSQLAKELQVDESVISRVVAGKTLTSPRGTFALHALFTSETITHHEEPPHRR